MTKRRKTLAGEHGSRSHYNKGCRHPSCVEANRIYQRDYYAKRRKRALTGKHGSRYHYRLGCRHPECVKANRDYVRRYHQEHYSTEGGSPKTTRAARRGSSK